MTPDDCKPGTVVMVHGEYVAAVVSVDTTTHREPWALLSNRLSHPLSHLQLAPRFLVEDGGWIAKSTGQTLLGIIDPPNERGWPWIAFPAYQASIGDVPCGNEPTYHAARQAVERACGMGAT